MKRYDADGFSTSSDDEDDVWQLASRSSPVVVRRRRSSFDLWGDTVNVAARLASHGASPSVHLSPAAWERVRGRIEVLSLGLIPIKGRGEMEVLRLETLRVMLRS